MTIRVDLEQRVITASIADLLGPPQDRGWARGVPPQARASLGVRCHASYRTERASQVAGFRSEVPIELRRQVDGFEVCLRGRIDGWIDDGSTLCIEEAKSVALSRAELDALDLAELDGFALQLRLYGLAARQLLPTRRLEARLLLLSLLHAHRPPRCLDVPLEPRRTVRRLDTILRAAIRQRRREQRRRKRLAACAAKLVFPYDRARSGQERLLDVISEGLRTSRPVLAQAATGTGKTVCALLAALRYALPCAAPLWFVTAKTTQQRLAARTFVDICTASGLAAPSLNAVTLRAKDRMCPRPQRQCHPELCVYLAGFDERLRASRVVDELRRGQLHIDPDLVYRTSTAAGLCPFEVSLQLASRTALVIGDYNYVFDSPSHQLERAPAPAHRRPVVIVDEAHNLPDRVRAALSPFVASAAIERVRWLAARGELNAPGDRAGQLGLRHVQLDEAGSELFRRLETLCTELSAHIDELLTDAAAEQLPFVQGSRPVAPDGQRWSQHGEAATRWLLRYGPYARVHQLIRPDDPAIALLGQLARVCSAVRARRPELVPYAAGSEASTGKGFGVMCIDPSPWLRALHRRARGTVAMSATLQPTSYYATLLGMADLQPMQACVPSPFPAEHRHVVVVPTVATTYRQRHHHARRIAELIHEVIQARAGRYIAFFPSFAFLSSVREHLELPTQQVLAQQPGMSLSARRQTLDRLATTAEPLLLLAVTGGVFAEGIDLPGEALIGAIVVGPALPPVSFERSLMRWYFDQQQRCGWAYAMLFPAMQRVIQAAGRVIRSMDDRGVIVLLGRRFGEPDYSACFPTDWYRYDPRELIVDRPGPVLRSFWTSFR